MEKQELKNEFRDEVAKEQVASKAEMLRRDQVVMKMELALKYKNAKRDVAFLGETLTRMEIHLNKLQALPECSGKGAAVKVNEQNIERIKAAIEQAKFGRADEVKYETLCQVLGVHNNGNDESDREPIAEVPVSFVPEKKFSGPKMGPVKTDEDDDDEIIEEKIVEDY